MNVSVILTVKDEEQAIGRLLDSLSCQSRMADEIVICDGGSKDDTLGIIASYQAILPLTVVSFPGSNISQGRNRAIDKAAGPIIASTDAGVRLSTHWLKDLADNIEESGAPVVSGWFEPDPQNDFEVSLGATVLPSLQDIDAGSFLPSSRSVAFLKSAWKAVGGYPEWLDYSEDLVFDMALRKVYGPFPFVPSATAYFRPRSDYGSFARQYYLYARGDGKANLWPKRHLIRYLTYLVVFPLIILSLIQGRWPGWLILVAGGAVYCRRPAQRLHDQTRDWQAARRTKAFIHIPAIRIVGDLAKMVGYPAGWWWRFRNRKALRD